MHSNGRVQTASQFAIDGIDPVRTVEPPSAEGVAEVLADAAANGLGLAPVGGATSLALGNPIERYDVAISTARLNDVLDYEPMDLVLSVEAGARFADVQGVLAEHGQQLPVETPFPEQATIGGMIATARSGPRRLSSGSLRDLLIGMRVAHASGTVTKCGGMVVKNVSGYDMPRVYHGSLGTLGVITSANFKVVPLPRAERTVVGPRRPLEEAIGTMVRLQQSGLPFVALELAGSEDGWLVAVRLEGREQSVVSLVDSSCQLIGSDAKALEDAASRDWWQQYLDEQAPLEKSLSFRSAVRPRDGLGLVRAINELLVAHDLAGYRMWASPGLGVVQTRWILAAEDVQAAMVHAGLSRLATHTIMTAAPADFKRQVDVWGPEPETLDVMRQLKRQFDPARVLNPGRFVGRL